MKSYLVNFIWDNDAGVWVATSNDVPGLVLEHGSFDALVERVKLAAPELLELNGLCQDNALVVFNANRQERLLTANG